MTTMAIIPARSGSRRIARKNIRLFAGRPMISYAIEAARAAGIFDQVIVSTDSDEIAAVAEMHGACAPFRRPAELAGDHVGLAPVLLHAIGVMEQAGTVLREVCMIYATAPLLRPASLHQGLLTLREKNADAVFSVATFPAPVLRSLVLDTQGWLRMAWPEHEQTRSQDLPESYHDAGQFHWVRVAAFKKQRRLYMDNSCPVIIPRYLAQDVDTEEDWRRAELLYAVLTQEERCDGTAG